MKDRIKEINQLIYLKSELIRVSKKEIKELSQERDSLYGEKRLVRMKEVRKHGKNN